MTKKEALQICYDMWSWLAQNPSKSKHDFLELHPEIQPLNSQCSCCEYVAQLRLGYGMNCNHCPIVGFWRRYCTPDDLYRRDSNGIYQDYCMGSVYAKWFDAEEVDRSRYAQMIADAAKAELDLIEG